MTNLLDTHTALLSETLLFSAIKKCTSLNCTDNISWSLCSCYRSHIHIILSTVNDVSKYVIAYFWTCISADIPFISFSVLSLVVWKNIEISIHTKYINIKSICVSVFQTCGIKKRASVELWSSWLRYFLISSQLLIWTMCLYRYDFFNRKFQAH